MGEIVNLNKARKNHNRELARHRAAENRIRHGRTAADKAKDREDARRMAKTLTGSRIEPE